MNYITLTAEEVQFKDPSIVIDGVDLFLYDEYTYEQLHKEGSGFYWYESSLSGCTFDGDWYHDGQDGVHHFDTKEQLQEYLTETYS